MFSLVKAVPFRWQSSRALVSCMPTRQHGLLNGMEPSSASTHQNVVHKRSLWYVLRGGCVVRWSRCGGAVLTTYMAATFVWRKGHMRCPLLLTPPHASALCSVTSIWARDVPVSVASWFTSYSSFLFLDLHVFMDWFIYIYIYILSCEGKMNSDTQPSQPVTCSGHLCWRWKALWEFLPVSISRARWRMIDLWMLLPWVALGWWWYDGFRVIIKGCREES